MSRINEQAAANATTNHGTGQKEQLIRSADQERPGAAESFPVLRLERQSEAAGWEECGSYPVTAQYAHDWERAIEVAKLFGPGRYRYTVEGGPEEVFQLTPSGEVEGVTF